MSIPITETEKINFKELMDYYGYKGTFGKIKMKMKLGRNYILQTLAEFAPTPKMIVALQRMKGVKIGKNVFIGHRTFIDILYPHLITIEDHVSMGYGMVFAHSNPTNSYLIKAKLYPREVKPVLIKEGAWVSAGVMVLPGVTIGEHAVIGAGSIVTKDIPPRTLAMGSPAKVIKKLDFGE